MQTSSLGKVSDESPSGSAKAWLEVCGPILWGLGFAAEAGERLLPEVSLPSIALAFVGLVWWLWQLRLVWRPKPALPSAWLYLLFRVCLALPYHYLLSVHVWGPPALGVLFAGFFWVDAKSWGRPSLISAINCALIGLLTLAFPLSNLQRCRFVILFVGIAIVLRGAVEAIPQVRRRRPDPPPTPAQSARRAAVGFLRLVFGKFEYVPVSSGNVEERVRTKYRSEIAELAGLGFDNLQCYGEAFPLARFACVLPAIIMLAMWFERKPLQIHGGTKIMACYPLLVSGDKTTYANPCEIGVKLFTAFTDGTFLVSAMRPGFGADGPTMTKYCGAASIGEAWAQHQLRIQAFESAGKRVDRQISFRTYADLSERETALL